MHMVVIESMLLYRLDDLKYCIIIFASIFYKVTRNLVKRAENAGFKALVLTIDAPYFGIRRDDIRNKFQLPAHLKMANFEGKL